jgi:Ca2+-binding RTX toxin-like protein
MKLGNYSHTANGGDGVDQIKGGTAVDTINGGNGNDKINGEGGADILTGGTGSDVFKYAAASDSGPGAASDRITDFTIGQDRLNFVNIDADAATAGDQAFTFLGTAAFANTGLGQLRYLTSGADLIVQADVNGDGVADMEMILQGLSGQVLTVADFVL